MGKKNFWNTVSRVLDEADIVIEVIDARFPELSRNKDVEKKAKAKGKELIVVLNKADLVPKEYCEKSKKKIFSDYRVVFVSSRNRNGLRLLRSEIGKASGKKNCKIAIVGYPNTGKSSLINALKGKASAGTGQKAGFTKGMQAIRISEKILLLDSPGVIPFEEQDEFLLALISAKNPAQLNDVEGVASRLLEFLTKTNSVLVEEKLGLDYFGKTGQELLEQLALKKKRFIKGGIPDTRTIAEKLLLDWQKGKI